MTGGEYLDAEYRLRTATSRHLVIEDGRGRVVKRHLVPEWGSTKKPQNPTTGYVGPACVWCWEVTRRREESVVHHQVITRE